MADSEVESKAIGGVREPNEDNHDSEEKMTSDDVTDKEVKHKDTDTSICNIATSNSYKLMKSSEIVEGIVSDLQPTSPVEGVTSENTTVNNDKFIADKPVHSLKMPTQTENNTTYFNKNDQSEEADRASSANSHQQHTEEEEDRKLLEGKYFDVNRNDINEDPPDAVFESFEDNGSENGKRSASPTVSINSETDTQLPDRNKSTPAIKEKGKMLYYLSLKLSYI